MARSLASVSRPDPEQKLHKGHPEQVAGVVAWKAYWAAMPPKPDDTGPCCLCGAPLPAGRRYLCGGCA